MLSWKPANTRGALLAVQEALTRQLGIVNYRELHYYVTKEDIATELGRPLKEIKNDELQSHLEGLGLDLHKEVYGLTMSDFAGPKYGYFVPQSSLERINADMQPFPTTWSQLPNRSFPRFRKKRFKDEPDVDEHHSR